jgi:hypothetical protein
MIRQDWATESKKGEVGLPSTATDLYVQTLPTLCFAGDISEFPTVKVSSVTDATGVFIGSL